MSKSLIIRLSVAGVLAILACTLAFTYIGPRETAIVISIATVCLVLWLLEVTPPFVPSLLLFVSIPLFLYPLNSTYSLPRVLGWATDPVLALFFGGFVLGKALECHRLDRHLASVIIRRFGSSLTMLLFAVTLTTAIVSMWISNIAAAAMMFASLRPLISSDQIGDGGRRAMLLGIAFGANLGGIATPIGTGPNAIAIAWLEGKHHVTFDDWIVFAFPLTMAMIVGAFVLLYFRFRIGDGSAKLRLDAEVASGKAERLDTSAILVVAVLIACMLLWLTEPIHQITASVVALAAAVFLFASRLLSLSDVSRIDWSTLLLIAGGITMGKLLEASGVVSGALRMVPFSEMHPGVTLLIFCLTSALLSALMSNTAAAVMLIPLASAVLPSPSTSILIAIACSFGMPFAISTPPNAMAYGEGGLPASDLFGPGITIMLAGCLLISLTGRPVMNLVGIP